MTRALLGLYVATLAAGVFALMYLAVAIPRVFYPFDLDFIEDSQLLQALRFAHGQPVFAAPTAEFAPHVYMPLYTWLAGWLLRLTGPSYVPLRSLSLAATLATSVSLGLIARRETQQTWVGLLCAGLYLAGYRISGFWYELARVDSLGVALAVGGLACGVYAGRSRRWLVGAAGLLTLAFFTKQTNLAFVAGLGIWLWGRLGQRAWWFLAPSAGFIGSGLAGLTWATQGWFYFYTFVAASGDAVEAGRVGHYIVLELFGVMGGLSLLTGWAVWRWLRSNAAPHNWPDQPWLWCIAVACFISGVGRASVGGNVNNLMPAYALLCLAPALAVQALANRPPARYDLALVGGLVLVQLALGAYNPARYLPTSAMRVSGEQLIQSIASTPGEVLVLMHPYYAVLAGKPPSAQIATLWYLSHWQGQPLPADFVARLQNHYYTVIISDESFFETAPVVKDLLTAHYQVVRALPPTAAPPTTVGLTVRPQLWWEPRP